MDTTLLEITDADLGPQFCPLGFPAAFEPWWTSSAILETVPFPLLSEGWIFGSLSSPTPSCLSFCTYAFHSLLPACCHLPERRPHSSSLLPWLTCPCYFNLDFDYHLYEGCLQFCLQASLLGRLLGLHLGNQDTFLGMFPCSHIIAHPMWNSLSSGLLSPAVLLLFLCSLPLLMAWLCIHSPRLKTLPLNYSFLSSTPHMGWAIKSSTFWLHDVSHPHLFRWTPSIVVNINSHLHCCLIAVLGHPTSFNSNSVPLLLLSE